MARKYYTLAVFDDTPGAIWCPEFGAYEREDVEAELDDYRDRGWPKRHLKILTTGGKQADIDAAVAALNEGLA